MNYIELKVNLSEDQLNRELMVYELGELGYESFQEYNEYLSAFIIENLFKESHLKLIESRFGDAIFKIEKIVHKADNWNKIWEDNFHPVIVNEDCVIRASFHSIPSVKYDILINPDMTFGTGHHETTLLMAKQLFKENFKGMDVLDMGTGTGILAIICSLLSARNICAVDIDERAVKNTIKNIEMNGIENISVNKGDSAIIKDGSFHFILANINKNILLKDMQTFSSVLKVNGKILLSGFLINDKDDLIEEGKKNGLKFVENIELNNWSLLILSK